MPVSLLWIWLTTMSTAASPVTLLCWFMPATSGRDARHSSWITPTSSGIRLPAALSHPMTLL